MRYDYIAELGEIITQDTLSIMTANQYRTAIAALGLNQAGAATFLGVSLRTSQGYALGEYPVPLGYAKLFRLMVSCKIKPNDKRFD